MRNIWRECPSGRLSTGDLFQTNDITQDFFEYHMIIKLILQNFDMPDTNIITAKQGDIIDVVDETFVGGRIERRTHLIIKVDIGNFLTHMDHLKAIRLERWSDNRLWFPNSDAFDAGVTLIEKRRYKIPWSELVSKAQSLFGITINMTRLLDENDEYQPLENVTFPVASLIHDKMLNKKLASSDFGKIRQAII